MFSKWAAALKYVQRGGIFAERRCVACHAPFFPDEKVHETLLRQPGSAVPLYLCPHCAPQLRPHSGPVCPLCGYPFYHAQEPGSPCLSCVATPPPWQQLVFYAAYINLWRALLLRYKSSQDFSLLPLLEHCLHGICAALPPCQFIIAIPRHPSRLIQRGCNQVQELCRPVAHKLGIPLATSRLCRTNATAPQSTLSLDARRKNQKGNFSAHNVAGCHILLVDDIMTTGATMHHATLALREAGAASVRVAVLGRTLHQSPTSADASHASAPKPPHKGHDKRPAFG